MKKTLITLFALGLIFILPACKDKKGCTDPLSSNYDPDADDDDGSCQYPGCMDPNSISYSATATVDNGSCVYGGSGGNTTLVAFLTHHGDTIPNKINYSDSVFVKYNAVNYSTTYDTVYVGDAPEDHVHLEGLKKGKYFLFAAGFDSSIAERVIGGLAVIITQDSGEVDVVVPVTE